MENAEVFEAELHKLIAECDMTDETLACILLRLGISYYVRSVTAKQLAVSKSE